MASISKYDTKKGTFYRATVYAGIDPETGKQRNITKRGFKTKKEANAWADKTRVAIAQGEKRAANLSKTITFQELYDDWYEQYILDVKPSTAKKTEELFRIHILPAFGHLRLQAINTQIIQRQVNIWHGSHSHYKTMYNYVKRLLEYGVSKKYITSNPADHVIVPRKTPTVQQDNPFWTKSELNTFLNACKEDSRKQVYPFFRLLAYTGMRRGEILALEWTDFHDGCISIRQAISIDLHGRSTISTPKTTTSIRTLPLDPGTISALNDWKQYATGRFIFYGDKPITDSMPGKWLHQICDRINLRPIKIHGLRHTHCSLLFEAGATIKEVQERLGHSSAEITLDIYTHLSQEVKESTPQKFAKFLEDY